VAGGVEGAHRDYLTRQVNEARDVLMPAHDCASTVLKSATVPVSAQYG
jgi:hypothetical protein